MLNDNVFEKQWGFSSFDGISVGADDTLFPNVIRITTENKTELSDFS